MCEGVGVGVGVGLGERLVCGVRAAGIDRRLALFFWGACTCYMQQYTRICIGFMYMC